MVILHHVSSTVITGNNQLANYFSTQMSMQQLTQPAMDFTNLRNIVWCYEQQVRQCKTSCQMPLDTSLNLKDATHS